MSDAAPTLEPAQRVVVRRAERVPLPRRLLAMALLFGILALVLNALPRPYKPVPLFVVHSLGTGFDDTRATISAAEKDEPVAGEATPEERRAYKWELWRHSWGGIARELALRTAFFFSGLCLFGSAGAAAREYRRSQKVMTRAGARLQPEVLRTETIREDGPPPIVLPKTDAPLLPDLPPPPPIVVDAPMAGFAVPDAKPAEKQPPALDPALAKLGFEPLPTPPVDDEGEKKPPNLAERTATTTVSSAPVAPPPAEPPLPIGIAAELRPVVRPGTKPLADEPSPEPSVENTLLSPEPSVEKTIPSPEPSVETTITSEPAASPEPPKDPKPE